MVRVIDIVPALQTAVGPVILISGVGLLLLSMTNRLGRIVDRSRELWRVLRQTEDDAERENLRAQLRTIRKRAEHVRRAVTLATWSIFLAAILIATIFVSALFQMQIAWVIAIVFVGCLAALIGSLTSFLREINDSLSALDLEVRID